MELALERESSLLLWIYLEMLLAMNVHLSIRVDLVLSCFSERTV